MKLSEEEIRAAREELIKTKLEKLARLEHELALKARFPHRYAMKFYPWQREWIDCREKIQCLTAANQVGKSLTMMRKTIEWITNRDLWPELWPTHRPRSAWYLYPTKDMALAEFNEKWRQMLPPQDDPEFGWTFIKGDKGSALLSFPHIEFDLHFKTYAQGATLLQAGTCSFIVLDEEVPSDLVSELQSRVAATDGYLIFGFTATIGQAFWKSVVEERTTWPNAWVRQISLYDCMKYEDGTPSPWTKERIQARIDQCTTKAEVQRRVFGKFVRDEGLRFPQFDREVHLAEVHPIPKDWEVYCGVDWGSGGEKGHPSAIVFTAVNPSYTQARVIRSWRGDKISTTAEDVIDMWLEMKSTIPNEITATYFDFAAADLGTIAGRRGLPWLKADKSRDSGNAIIAALLKSKAIKFYIPSDGTSIPHHYLEGFKLAQEFESLGAQANKAIDRDDGIDSLRYSCVKIPFQIQSRGDSYILEPEKKQEVYFSAADARTNPQALKVWQNHGGLVDVEEEFELWNSMLEG